jgi:hypothetical protein
MDKSTRKKRYTVMLDPNTVQAFTNYELQQNVKPGSLMDRALKEYLINRGIGILDNS